MAYVETCDQKPAVLQYLQSTIIQLLNDHIPYNETLQILGVLCVSVDDQVDEVVIKVNSTLKRINSLTPPKERSPDLKNTSINVQLKNATCYNARETDSFAVPEVLGAECIPSPLSLDASLSVPHKSRGRKQPKPAKVKPVDYSQDECLGENDQSCVDLSPSNESINCSRKRKYSFQNDDKAKHSGFELSRCSSLTGLKVKKELQNEENYSQVGLNLSLFPKKHMKIEKEGCFATSSNGNDKEQVVSTSSLRSAFIDPAPSNSSIGSSKSHFIALLKHSPIQSAQPTSSLYRRILPNNNFKSHLASNSFLPNNCINSEFKNEDDYLLDCLSSDGKKRRRRSLEDALTADEMLEYMGSHDKSEASFACRICGEVSPDLLKYFHHTLSYHKAFICHQCGRCFTTKSSLLRHRPIHTGLRRFACGICHKAFYRKDKCKAHIKKHAEVQDDQDPSHNLHVL